eukprot:7086067-Alexandrium_andersonii.AAC.1
MITPDLRAEARPSSAGCRDCGTTGVSYVPATTSPSPLTMAAGSVQSRAHRCPPFPTARIQRAFPLLLRGS